MVTGRRRGAQTRAAEDHGGGGNVELDTGKVVTARSHEEGKSEHNRQRPSGNACANRHTWGKKRTSREGGRTEISASSLKKKGQYKYEMKKKENNPTDR